MNKWVLILDHPKTPFLTARFFKCPFLVVDLLELRIGTWLELMLIVHLKNSNFNLCYSPRYMKVHAIIHKFPPKTLQNASL